LDNAARTRKSLSYRTPVSNGLPDISNDSELSKGSLLGKINFDAVACCGLEETLCPPARLSSSSSTHSSEEEFTDLQLVRATGVYLG
jgi:hypothetical protein